MCVCGVCVWCVYLTTTGIFPTYTECKWNNYAVNVTFKDITLTETVFLGVGIPRLL